MSDDSHKCKILIFAADPSDLSRLRLGIEYRDIDASLRQSKLRDSFELRNYPATRPGDLRKQILNDRPGIVHFSGHGTGPGGLVLESDTGKSRPVTGEAIGNLFRLFEGKVQCVLLNSCYSAEQAEIIAKHVPYVIGMTQQIGDQAAIDFAVGFYDAIFAGQSIDKAFDFGCNAIQLEQLPNAIASGSSGIEDRTLLPVGEAHVRSKPLLPEHLKPKLVALGVVRTKPLWAESPIRTDRRWQYMTTLAVCVILGIGFWAYISGKPSSSVTISTEKGDTDPIIRATKKGVADVALKGKEANPQDGNAATQIPPKSGEHVRRLTDPAYRSWLKLWPIGSTVRVGITKSDDRWVVLYGELFQSCTREWSKHANVNFEFVDYYDNADAYVSLQDGPTNGLRSASTGTDSTKEKPSIRLSFARDSAPNYLSYARSVTLQSVGHLLGLFPMHKHPRRTFDWTPKIFDHYKGAYHSVSDAYINENILSTTNSPVSDHCEFDPLSIMMFPIPPGCATTKGTPGGPFVVSLNTDLSRKDREWVARLYPR